VRFVFLFFILLSGCASSRLERIENNLEGITDKVLRLETKVDSLNKALKFGSFFPFNMEP
jgi:hypothetical protein